MLNSEFTVTAAQVIDVLPQPASAMRITSSNATPHSQNGNYFPAYAAAQSVLPYSFTPLRQEPQEGRALLREVHPAHQLDIVLTTQSVNVRARWYAVTPMNPAHRRARRKIHVRLNQNTIRDSWSTIFSICRYASRSRFSWICAVSSTLCTRALQKEKKRTLENQIRRAQSRITAAERKRRTRQLILIGSVVKKKADQDSKTRLWLDQTLDEALDCPQDRELFDLGPE